MIEGLEIKGGAGPFEAAVIAVVLDRIAQEENRRTPGECPGEALNASRRGCGRSSKRSPNGRLVTLARPDG